MAEERNQGSSAEQKETIDIAGNEYRLSDDESAAEDLTEVNEEMLADLDALAEQFPMGDPVHIYLKEISKVPPLSPDEEAELTRSISTDTGAADRLAEANLCLAASIARRYMGCGVLFSDLIQAGNLGLVEAVEKFDCTKGRRFSVYAAQRIRRAITRTIAEQEINIHIPFHPVGMVNRIICTRRRLAEELGRAPLPNEIAAAASLPLEQVCTALKIVQESGASRP